MHCYEPLSCRRAGGVDRLDRMSVLENIVAMGMAVAGSARDHDGGQRIAGTVSVDFISWSFSGSVNRQLQQSESHPQARAGFVARTKPLMIFPST